MNKTIILLISVVLSGSFAVTVNAKPIAAVAIVDDSVELRRLETIGIESASLVHDSTQIKIMGAAGAQIIDAVAASGLNPIVFASRARPSVVTQAMTSPAYNAIAASDLDDVVAAASESAFTGPVPAAQSDNGVLLVSEPPMLLLLVFGMLLARVRRNG